MMRLSKTAAVAALLMSMTAVHAQTNADAGERGVPYASAAEALAGLRAKAGVTFSKNGDWTIAKDTDGVMWSFTPENHYAYPSVGRRRLVEHEGRFYVQTDIRCQAEKPACDRLRADYQLLDKRMMDSLRASK
jgi:hypothetical protein